MYTSQSTIYITVKWVSFVGV